MYKETPVKNLNKGYGQESSSQEKKDLMNDDPIASHASKGSFMSKHSHSSPSPLSMYGGKKGDDSKSKKDYE
jgi:hypothetical protein